MLECVRGPRIRHKDDTQCRVVLLEEMRQGGARDVRGRQFGYQHVHSPCPTRQECVAGMRRDADMIALPHERPFAGRPQVRVGGNEQDFNRLGFRGRFG